MSEQDTQPPEESHPRENDLNELEGSPVPDPEEERGDAEDDPGAD